MSHFISVDVYWLRQLSSFYLLHIGQHVSGSAFISLSPSTTDRTPYTSRSPIYQAIRTLASATHRVLLRPRHLPCDFGSMVTNTAEATFMTGAKLLPVSS